MGSWHKFWGIKEPLTTRDYTVPEKVFIEREGPYSYQYEWSEEAPGGLNVRVQNLLTGYYGCQNYIELFYSLPEVFAPVHEIAKRVSDANWQLCKEWNDEIDYTDEDFNRLFTQPNPLLAFKDFVYQAVCYEILTGKQFFHFNKPRALTDEYKSIITWSNVISPKVHIEMKKNVDPYTATSMTDFVSQYELTTTNGKRTFKPEEILPILHLDLSGNYDLNKTKAPISGADKAIKNLIPVYEARGIIYIKRGAMGFFVSRKKDESGMIALTPTEMKQASEQINKDYGLTNGKATIGVTQAPIDFVKTSMSISEMQPFDETLADAIAIYKVLRVPRHLVPSKDNSTFSNADTDMKSFYSDVIIPWGKRYAEAWTNYMKLKDFRRYIKADYAHVDALQENRQEKATYQKTEGDTMLIRFQNGVCSLNDWIVSNGDKAVTGVDLYKKKLFEMTPEEIALVKEYINLKNVAKPEPVTDEKEKEKDSEPAKLKAV